jgi:short-chain Z-isoprenyl diphosphate synthase
MSFCNLTTLPRHLGIIPDGNRRWAIENGMPILEGHRRGVSIIPDVLGWCADAGIEIVTVFMLSPGNLTRSPSEGLTGFVEQVLCRMVDAHRFRLNPIGALDLLPESTVTAVKEAQTSTAGNQGPLINLALGYAGRQDILSAVCATLSSPALRDLPAHQAAAMLTTELIDRHISTTGQPDLDLIIRTSGESRLSGFLTWQSEQSELYFCPRHWPDFTKNDLAQALESYAARQRRYGK